MRRSVLGEGNWSKMAKEEADLQRAQREKREARIASVALANLDDPDFTFGVLCERFSESDPYTLRKILRERCWVEVASNGQTLVLIPTKFRIVH